MSGGTSTPPAPENTSTTTNPETTIGDVVTGFLADIKTRLKPSTVVMYGVYLDRFKVMFGATRVRELLPADIHRWMLKQGKSGTTHGIALRSVSACLGWAEKNDMMPSNPAKKVPKPKSKSRSAETVISEEQHQRLMAVADPEFRMVLQVLWATGCRPSEAAGITAETFDAVNSVVKLANHKSDRTGKVRLIFLPPDVVTMLKMQLERFGSGALLRSNKGYPWTGRSITEAMRRVQAKTGIKCIAYGYRHGFATAALAKGIPDAQVAALLGHTSTAVLHAHYSHLTSQATVLRDAVGKVRG